VFNRFKEEAKELESILELELEERDEDIN